MALSNTLLGVLNAITALISLPIIGFSIWLAAKHTSLCTRALQWPLLALGLFILLISLTGLFGSFARTRGLLALYMAALLLLLLALLTLSIFILVVTNKTAAHVVSDRGFQEYRLGDYSSWLQRNVVDKPAYWRKIKSCLFQSKVCKSLQKDSHITSLSSFYAQSLSPIQSGCCKPPLACNFTYVNATTWIDAANVNVDGDCAEWDNSPNELCFDCTSCKAGLLQDAKDNWKKVAIFNGALLVLLILIFTLSCCAIENCRRRKPSGGFYVKA